MALFVASQGCSVAVDTRRSGSIKDAVLRRAGASTLLNACIVDLTAYMERRIAVIESLQALVATG